jgi:hypothetical protein
MIKRLYKQWKKRDLIIAVDFDDTLKPFRFQSEKKCLKIINLLKKCQQLGAHIIIFTASDPRRFTMMRSYCERHKLIISGINENAIELPFGNDGKIFYNILLDDRTGLTQAYYTLLITYWLIKFYKLNN